MRTWSPVLLLFGWLVFVPTEPGPRLLPAPQPLQESRIDYNRDILPILAHTCFNCHGPADKKSGLRLDVRADALRPTRTG